MSGRKVTGSSVLSSIAAVAVGSLFLLRPAAAQVPLQRPAAAVWSENSRSWLVSNLGENGGQGWISRLDAADKKAEPRWLTGLRTPRGMALLGEQLYVADGNEVLIIDTRPAVVVGRVRIRGARLLAGLAVNPGGEVYVSDMLTNTIHLLTNRRTVRAFLTSEQLQGPTGLLVNGPHLIAATWGTITDPHTLSTRNPGRLMEVDLRTKAVTPISKEPLGNLDGVCWDGSAYVVSDRLAGKLLRVSPDGSPALVRAQLRSPASLGYNPRRRILAVPELDGNDVVFISLP